MSDILNPLGRFYAVCMSNPPMVMVGTVGRNEANAKILYLAKSLSIEEQVVRDIACNQPRVFDSMWESLLSYCPVQVRRFDAPDPSTPDVP